MADYLFFDLDGTLTDPFEGISGSILHALDRMGLDKPERSFLRRFIGPPLVPSFREYLGMTADMAEEALRYYREYFSVTGLFENTVYPGIPETLGKLREAGFVLCVATSKPEPFARRILEHFSLDGHFAEICGATLDGVRGTKAEVLFELLRRLPPEDNRCLMIGDRRHDAEGAREAGLRTVGVLWGYGSREELTEAGCAALAEVPADLCSLLTDSRSGAPDLFTPPRPDRNRP